MQRTQLISLVVVGLLAAFILYLATRERQPPLLPTDEEHARFITPEACMTCHDLEGEPMQRSNHPLKRDCLDCHGRR